MASTAKSLYADCQRSIEANGIGRLESLRNTQLLVTGGTGFVGSWICTLVAYLNDHHDFRTQVAAVSRRPARFEEQAAILGRRKDIRHVASDIRQLVEVPAETSWIVHAAATPDARQHASNPIETAAVIAEGTARIFAVAERAVKLQNILHLSSGLVGASTDPSRIGATSIYAEAKRYSEALCAAYRSQARLPVVVARPFTFVGPFQALDAPWAVNNFLHAALNGLPLKIFGSGAASRSYLYGSDMATLALLQLVGGKSGQTYDLGGSEVLTTRELADIVVKQVRRPLEIRVNTAGRDEGVARLVPDLRPSVQEFGFRPAFAPREAVARTVAWFEGTEIRLGRAS